MMFYQTTDYDTFNPFLNRFLEGLKVLDEAARLSYTERAGVRFLDAVCPEASETIDQYLVPSVLGIFRELEPRGSLSCRFRNSDKARGKHTDEL